MNERQRLTEKAKAIWDEMLRYDFDFDFVLDEYGTTKASAEQDAEHMLEGEKGEGYRDDIYEALRELHFTEEEISGINQACLENRMQEMLVEELKNRL